MKRTILSAAALLLVATCLQAQSIAGTWQGRLPIAALTQNTTPGSALRVVFTIQKSSDSSLHGSISLIDRGNSTPLTSISVSAPNVTFTLGDNVNFHGKLSADGQSIAGTWTQGDRSFPLTLELATADTLWHREGPTALPPMAANADPAFEVATIKPCEPVEHGVSFDLTGLPFVARDVSAKELIKIAYNLRGRQVLGGPSWLDENKYDVTAKSDTPGRPSEDQGRTMVRKLLVERFHLACHTEEQLYPVFALTLDPKGPRPTPSDPNNTQGNVIGHQDGGEFVQQFSGVTMQQFLGFIMNVFQDKQLVDETGLTGAYDITLRFPASVFESPDDRGPNDERGTAIINAAQHTGFKFVSKKEPLPVVMVDHIDPPTPN